MAQRFDRSSLSADRARAIEELTRSLNRQECMAAFNAIKNRLRHLDSELAQTLMTGDVVEFHGRDQGTITGVVEKMNRGTVHVRATKYSLFGQPKPGEVWRVQASLLTKVVAG